MTSLKQNSPLRRETASIVRYRPLVVELEPHVLRIRRKGDRSGYTVPYDAIFSLGARLVSNRERAERAAQKLRRHK